MIYIINTIYLSRDTIYYRAYPFNNTWNSWRLVIITITLVVTYVYVKSYHYWSYNIKVGIIKLV